MRQSGSVTTLERLRVDRGLSQRDVQRAAGLNRRTLKQLELAQTNDPRVGTIQRLARLYEVEPAWLLEQIRHDRHARTERDAA